MKQHIIVAFDMDETIGYFSQLGLMVDALQMYLNRKLTKIEMYELFDLFQDIFRTDIFEIFQFLKKKKQKNKSIQIIIFTNNQAPREWSIQIKNYINHRLKYELFDEIIGPYKINEQIIEPLRTSHGKKYDDLKDILQIQDKNHRILFVDDRYHRGMTHKNTKNIVVQPYYYYYDFTYMIDRIIQKNILFDYKKYNKEDMREALIEYISHYNYTIKDDIIPTKKERKELFNKIKKFFNLNKKTKKKSFLSRKNKTKKRKK